MEERLFLIGVIMGVYALGTRSFDKSKKLDDARKSAGWHALFCFLAGFSAMIVLTVSWVNRGGMPTHVAAIWEPRALGMTLAVAIAAAVWGYRSASASTATAKARKELLLEDLEWADTVFSAVILAAFMMYFLIQAFKIPSGSMRQTLLEGDHLFVNKIVYGIKIPYLQKRFLKFRSIRHGDVVVFSFPDVHPDATHCGSPQAGKDFIKRVIGEPGDVVEVKEGVVLRNGAPLVNESYAQYRDMARIPPRPRTMSDEDYQRAWEDRKLDERYGEILKDHFGPVRVPEGNYLVMGDNRDRSCDGRFWGPVPERDIKGKAWFIYWPPARISGIH